MERKRPIQKIFFVNEEENDYIKNKMNDAKINNFSVYARLILMNGAINVIDFELIKSLKTEVNRIGVNINQIVKRIHETESEIRQDDFMEMIQLQKQ
ncbi:MULTISPECIES: plasmid mobilization relaxosome protein MobC, partial [unclassified Granulicatella]|uniref:plasmid mobilization protein n=1 Tax=unclassified Granulicatella TaxID=2630493 RepID=UPI001074380D